MVVHATAGKIAQAARQLLEEHGVEAVTMRRVANAVGITPMAVYRHYADRDGLLNALADTGFDELAARLADLRKSGDIERRLRKTLDTYVDHALENPRLFELMFFTRRKGARRFPDDFKARRSPTANISVELIEEAINTGYFRKQDAWEISFEMGALLQGLIMLYLGGRLEMTPARFRAVCHRALRRYMNGIRS